VGPRHAGRSRLAAFGTTTSSLGSAAASASSIRAASSIRSGSGSGSGTGRACANMGCAAARGADLPHSSRRSHVGRRTDRAPSRAQRSFVGPVRRLRSARADVGLARACAIAFRSAARPFVGRQQTGSPGSVHAGPFVGLARKRVQAAGFRVGRRVCPRLLGRPRRSGAERSPGRGAVVERTGRARMGCSQDPGASRPGRAIVVGPIGRAGAAGCTGATPAAGANAATPAAGANAATPATATGRCSRVVAARRVACPAAVPRATRGGIARRRGLAAGRGSGTGPSAVAVARGDGPTPNARPSGTVGARCGRHDHRAGRGSRSRRGRCPRRHRSHARMAATTAGGASGPTRRPGPRRSDTAPHRWRESTGRADDRVRP
jgi:hypothetical protein